MKIILSAQTIWRLLMDVTESLDSWLSIVLKYNFTRQTSAFNVRSHPLTVAILFVHSI